MQSSTPFYSDVRSRYDSSDYFLALFSESTHPYGGTYPEYNDMPLGDDRLDVAQFDLIGK